MLTFLDFKKIAVGCFLAAFLLPNLALAKEPSDPNYGDQWYWRAINAPAAWEKTTGRREVIVAVLDTGVEYAHPDLQDNIWTNTQEIPYNGIDDDKNGYVDDIHGWDFVNDQSNPGPDSSLPNTKAGLTHGTIVAGLIGAVGQNATDGVGLNWKVSIMPLKALDGEGVGNPFTVEKAIDYAIAKGASVINLSFIGVVHGEELYRAIQRAYMANVVVVTAAGNGGENFIDGDLDLNPQYPVCYSGPSGEPWWVIGVAAVDKDGAKAPFSGFGFRCVDISAPGVKMPGTIYFHPQEAGWNKTFGGEWSGTSLAAPLVSGSVALLKAYRPQLTVKQIYDLLMNSADNIESKNPFYPRQLGAGMLNVGRMLEMAEEQFPEIKIELTAQVSKSMAGKLKIDLDNDGTMETVQAFWGKGQVKILNQRGLPKMVFTAYNKYKGSFAMTIGDWDNDGQLDIITAQPVKNPIATIWSQNGQKKGEIKLSGDYRRGLKLSLVKK